MQVLTESVFHETNADRQALSEMMTKLHAYTVQKFVAEEVLSDFHIFLTNSRCDSRTSTCMTAPTTLSTTPSKVYYMELVDENPDSEETMAIVAEDLLDKLRTFVNKGWVLLVDNGKTYQHLMKVKRQYGTSLERLLIFLGDWHVLKNYQETLMKVYYRAGLKEIAQHSGFQGKTLCSLETCSNFKRTHNFLLQVWEALYCVLIQTYSQQSATFSSLIPTLKCIISAATCDETPPSTIIKHTLELLEDSDAISDFNAFTLQNSTADDTYSYWSQFVFKDCFTYIALYLAIRGFSWHFRVASLKPMAPLFCAFDRDLYHKLIPNHLADIHKYPPHILHSLQAGGFTVNLTGREWHSVALDEAHEMCINNDLKLATVYPTTSYL